MIEVIEEDKGYVVDEATGEILHVYQYSEMKPMTKAEKMYYKYTGVSPKSVRSKDELNDFMSACVDKRRLVTYNGTMLLHDMSCGQAKREGVNLIFTIPQYKIMNRLVKGLVYSNVVVGSKAEVADILCCKQCNISRALRPVEHLTRVQTEGMAKGQIKILVHPAYGFRYESHLINKARDAAIKSWIRDTPLTENDLPKREFVFTKELDIWLESFSKSIKGEVSEQLKEMGVY